MESDHVMPSSSGIQSELGRSPAFWFISLAVLIIPLFALLAIDQYALFGAVLLVLVICLVVFARLVPLIYLLALIPLSQPFPVSVGARDIGIFPEYIVLPMGFLALILFRLRDNDLRIEKTGFVLPWLGFLMIAAVSLILSASTLGFSAGIAGIGFLYALLLALMIYLLVLEFVVNSDRLQDLLFVLFLSFGLLSAIGVVEYFAKFDPQMPSSVRITSLFDTIFWEEGRGNPNSFGTFLSIFIILAVSLRKEYSSWKRQSINFALLLGAGALVLTGSRSSLLALALSLLLLQANSVRRFLAWLIPLSLVAVVVVLLTPSIGDRITSIYTIATDERILRLFSSIDPTKVDWEYVHYYGLAGYDSDLVSGAMRIPSWLFGLRCFVEHPLLGVGPKMNAHFTGMETSENLFLDVAVMTGILGTVMFGWISIRILRLVKLGRSILRRPFDQQYIRAYRSMLVCLFIVSLTGSILFNLKLLLIFWTLTALLWRVVNPKSEERS